MEVNRLTAYLARLRRTPRLLLFAILAPVVLWRLQLLCMGTGLAGTGIVLALKLGGYLPVPWPIIFMCLILPAILVWMGALCGVIPILATDAIMELARKLGYPGN